MSDPKGSSAVVPSTVIPQALRKLVEGIDLTVDEADDVMSAIMEGQGTQAQIGALLAVLRAKHETSDELTGLARAMRARSVRVAPMRTPLVDTCGTGGDLSGTFNISTSAAFVIAAGGVGVAKHGNRAATSKCGSADVLEALGVKLSITAKQVADCIDQIGIGFLFAPNHHPAMLYAAQPRRELGIRTVFNVLGPLTNPAGAVRQVLGVYHPALCPLMASALSGLGCERAMVVFGLDGLDEVSTFCPTRVSFLHDGEITTETITPADLGMPTARHDDVLGGRNPMENAAILRGILQGEPGPRSDIVIANAAAGLIVGGVADGWKDAVVRSREIIASGAALTVLNQLVDYTRSCETDEHTV